MTKKFFQLFVFQLFLSLHLISQKCPSSYQKGTLLINESEEGTLCYLRMPDQKTENDIYHTSYTFKANGTKETYYLDFYYYKSRDSISIIYSNPKTGYTESNFTRINRGGSLWMFKDYKANDTLINRFDPYRILFNIPEPEVPYITLNRFLLPEDPTVSFLVSDINPLQLRTHLAEAKLYLLRNPSENTTKEKREKDISNLLKEMKDYRDSVINQLKNEEQSFSNNGQIVEADDIRNEMFAARLNPIFSSYYKNVFPYQDYNSTIQIVFLCGIKGKIERVKDIYSINSLPVKWFEDSFKNRVMEQIAVESFKNMTELWKVPQLKQSFDNKYLERIKKLTLTPEERHAVNQLQKQIYEDFTEYRDKEINRPTIYTYRINYQSILKYEVWEYHVATSKKPEILGPVDTNEAISEDLKSKFRRDFIRAKISKYNIKRCDVKINNELKGQDIQLIN